MNEVTPQMYAETFATPVGAAVLEDIQLQGFVYLRIRRGTVIDPNNSVFCDGARSLALHIREMVQVGKTRSTVPPQTHARTGGEDNA